MGEDRQSPSYVSRGGEKLAAALDQFQINPAGMLCVDLGCNVGGFTDCLLQRGAAHVIAVDTGYGALAWKLRQSEQVTVLERTNAMHVDVAALMAGRDLDDRNVGLVVIDLGWTPQRHAIPAAVRWEPKEIVSLVKPHYELDEQERKATGRKKGKVVLDEAMSVRVARRVVDAMQAEPPTGYAVKDWCVSPVRGGSGKKHAGNTEYLLHLSRVPGG